MEKKKKQVKKEYDECLESLMQLEKQATQLDKEKSDVKEQIDRTLMLQFEMEANIDNKWKGFQLAKEKVAQMKTERSVYIPGIHLIKNV